MKINSIKKVSGFNDIAEYNAQSDIHLKNYVSRSIIEKCEFELNNNQNYKDLEKDYLEAINDNDLASCNEILKQMESTIIIICYKSVLNSLLSI